MLARLLRSVGTLLPSEHALLLGGSYARGEPCIARTNRARSLSDIDLLLVFDGPVPAVSEATVVAALENEFPTATCYSLQRGTYEHIRTALGVDFKRDAVRVEAPGSESVAVPDVTERDAYEVFLYAAFEFFSTLDAPGPSSDPFAHAYLWSRVALNAMKSVGMLDGAWAYHDLVVDDGPLSREARRQLTWRAQPSVPGPTADDAFAAISSAFAEHRTRGYAAKHHDAVVGSEYEGRTGGSYVSLVHSLVYRLLDDLLTNQRGSVAESRLELAQAWARTCEAVRLARAAPSAGEHFRSIRKSFQEQLLMMKTWAA